MEFKRYDLDPSKESYILQMKNIPFEPEFEKLWSTHPKERGSIMMYGKVLDVPRWQKNYGADYLFSKIWHKGAPIQDPFMIKIKTWVEVIEKAPYDNILMNWYMDDDYISSHADAYGQIKPGTPIYSFTFCDAEYLQIFRIRNFKKEIIMDIQMPNRSLLVMCGDMQQGYKHEVPKSMAKKGRRVNITLRQFTDEN